MIRQRVKSFEVRSDAQADFDTHTQKIMQDMVWTGTCRSWCKSHFTIIRIPNRALANTHTSQDKRGTNGKVTGLWPGSSLHYIQVLSEDRWEDYNWEHKAERYSYWGHGFSWIENPDLDPLGAGKQNMIEAMTTIPSNDSDLSFYLWKSNPLPKSCIPAHEEEQYAECARVEDFIASRKEPLSNGLTNGHGADIHIRSEGITVPV